MRWSVVTAAAALGSASCGVAERDLLANAPLALAGDFPSFANVQARINGRVRAYCSGVVLPGGAVLTSWDCVNDIANNGLPGSANPQASVNALNLGTAGGAFVDLELTVPPRLLGGAMLWPLAGNVPTRLIPRVFVDFRTPQRDEVLSVVGYAARGSTAPDPAEAGPARSLDVTVSGPESCGVLQPGAQTLCVRFKNDGNGDGDGDEDEDEIPQCTGAQGAPVYRTVTDPAVPTQRVLVGILVETRGCGGNGQFEGLLLPAAAIREALRALPVDEYPLAADNGDGPPPSGGSPPGDAPPVGSPPTDGGDDDVAPDADPVVPNPGADSPGAVGDDQAGGSGNRVVIIGAAASAALVLGLAAALVLVRRNWQTHNQATTARQKVVSAASIPSAYPIAAKPPGASRSDDTPSIEVLGRAPRSRRFFSRTISAIV